MRFVNFIVVFCFLFHANLQAQYSDDFENANTIHQWQIFQSGNLVYYESLVLHDSLIEGDMLTGSTGKLVMISGATYWYADVTGPYVYQMTWGDFTATTSVRSLDRDNTLVPPQREYNSTGLILRNPNVASGQNYIMTNLGYQSNANQLGSESKTTINSTSTLFLDPDLHEGVVRIQRIGTLIRTYKRTAGDADFVLLDEFNRPDIPDTVQIGMVQNGYTDNPDIRGEFEYIDFTGGDCRIVRNANDSGVSSLREAISCAQPGDTITFDHVTLYDTIEVTSEPLLIDKDIILWNTDPDSVTIDGVNLPLVIDIVSGVTVTIVGVHLSNENDTGQFVIRNQGSLSLVNCTFSGDTALDSVIETQVPSSSTEAASSDSVKGMAIDYKVCMR